MPNKVEPLQHSQKWKAIKKKVCSRYVFAKSIQKCDDLCACGHRKSEHSGRALERRMLEEDEWNPDIDTETYPTDAFGEIEFIGFNQRIGKYCRVADDTVMDEMKSLLFDEWKLKTPNLIISVTGGARSFKMKPRLKEMFQRGLMKVASTTGAWIITGGNHSGVMKHVGEAVREYSLAHTSKTQIVCVGIAPWGYVSNQSDLIDPRGLWPAQYRMEPHIVKRGEIPLDCNHTHFILVDNGTKNKSATEIPFRVKLEYYISTMKTSTGCDKVPIVCVLLEGGPGSLETVYRAVDVGTPAVIVQGSGRMADLLAFAYFNSTEKKSEDSENSRCGSEISECLEKKLLERLKSECPKHVADQNSWTNKHFTFIRNCLNKRDLITVFQVSGNNSVGTSLSIDLAILKALLKANKDQTIDQLRLALAWNRVDIAQSEIFTDHINIPCEQLDEVMLMALKLDRVDFIRLLLENGVNTREFLTIQRLLNLYNNLPKNSLLLTLLRKSKQSETFTYKDIGKLISELMGDFYKPLYLRDVRYDINDSKTSQLITSTGEQQTPRSRQVRQADGDPDFDEPTRELFIWAVLLNRQNMANLFWEEGKEKLAAALTASKLLKSLKKKTDDSELKKTISTAALLFQNMAIGVLNECHCDDGRKAKKLLTRQMNQFGNTTCLLLAVRANNKSFISHPCCQLLLNNIWMGDINEETKTWRMCLCVMCPLFVMSRKVIAFTDDRTSITSRYVSFFQAPVVTFMYNCISYVIFLMLFSYVVLFDFNPTRAEIPEIVLSVWVGTFLVEEIRQLVVEETSSNIKLKFHSYIKNGWNILDLLGIGLFILTLALRFIDNVETFQAARILLAFDLMMFFFRSLHIFYARKSLGPKLVMIGKMTMDLTYFVVILMVFVLAYGLASQAILYPNSPFNGEIIISVLRKSYFQMYGELFLEEIEGQDECTTNRTLWITGSIPRCPEYLSTIIVPILLGMYILFTNVLMFNLLIAIFSYTFNRIQENTDRYWNFQRYYLINEYFNRPPIPPPGVIVCHLYIIIKSLRNNPKKSTNIDVSEKSDDESKQLVLWENMNCEEFLHRLRRDKDNSLEYRLRETMKRVDQLSQRIDHLQEIAQNVTPPDVLTTADCSRTDINPSVQQSEFQSVTDSKLNCIIETLKTLQTGDEKRKRKKEKKQQKLEEVESTPDQ